MLTNKSLIDHEFYPENREPIVKLDAVKAAK